MDARRQNLSVESLKANVERLKDYQKRLIVFPRRAGVVKAGDSAKADLQKVSGADAKVVRRTGVAQPIRNTHPRDGVSTMKKSEMPKEEGAYRRLRVARSDQRLVGVREKRAKAKADEAQAAKK